MKKPYLAAGILAGCSSFLIAGCGTQAAKATPTSSPVNPQATYFKGKTLTLIAPDKPGGGYDRWARLAAPYLAHYLHATIKVVNVPGAGTIVGTNELYRSTPNGLTLGLVDVSGDIGNIIEHQPGQDFSLTKFSYLGQPTVNVVAVFANPSSPYSTLQSLIHASKPVPVLDIASGVGDVTNKVILGALGVPMKLITGYANGKTLETGFLAGDGPIASGTYSSWYSVVKAHKATPLMVTWLGSTWPVSPHTLTLGHIIKTYSLSPQAKKALTATGHLVELGYDFAVPPKTPAARVAYLRLAFTAVIKNPGFIKKADQEGLDVHYIAGSTVSSLIHKTLAHQTAVSAYLH